MLASTNRNPFDQLDAGFVEALVIVTFATRGFVYEDCVQNPRLCLGDGAHGRAPRRNDSMTRRSCP